MLRHWRWLRTAVSCNRVRGLVPRPTGDEGPSYRFGGPRNRTNVGPVEMCSKILASVGPESNRRSLPMTCHQKFSSRLAVGSFNLLKVVV
jgi:hypothetical protein